MLLPETRRAFLRQATGSAVLLSGGARPGAAARPPTLEDEAFWEEVRAGFAFREDAVPMNAANLCPSFGAVAEAAEGWAREIDVDCSFQNRARFAELIEAARGKVAAPLNASADEIALVRNTSEANTAVNNGFAFDGGEEVVVWDQNHPTNNVAWDVRAARFGAIPVRVSTPPRPGGASELVDAFVAAFTPRTRVLAITHVSNVSGVRLPVRELCEEAHRRGIFVHVDGAQGWGALDIDLKALGCDAYTASAHKWYCGPREVGLLYLRAEHVERLWPGEVAPGWGDDAETDLVGARKFESLGQRDDARLAALGTAADLHAGIGPAGIEGRVLELATRLKEGILERGGRLVTPLAPELSGGVCITEAPPEQRRAAMDRLYREHGIAGAPTGGLRLCPHLYNTRDHVERALAGLAAVRSLRG